MSENHPAYLFVKSNRQGIIEGVTGHNPGARLTNGGMDTQNMILVNMADNTLTRAINSDTGEVVGAPHVGELSCSCNLDRSTTKLFKALFDGDECEVKLFLFHNKKALMDGGVIGTSTHIRNWFTLELEKARVVTVTLNGGQTDSVQLGFSYNEIRLYNHDNNGVMSTYQWGTDADES